MIVAPLEIGAVARELGVAPSTLRSWERRYRTVVPRRGPNGQRLYDSDQIVALKQILAQVRQGVRAKAAHVAAGLPTTLAASHCSLASVPEASQLARREVDRVLERTPLRNDERFGFNLRLIASELVNNAVLYGGNDEAIALELEVYPDGAELCIHNAGGRMEIRRLRARRSLGGHGLEIVDALADSWTIETGPGGTRVRVRVSAKQDGPGDVESQMFAVTATG